MGVGSGGGKECAVAAVYDRRLFPIQYPALAERRYSGTAGHEDTIPTGRRKSRGP
ncbi:MAG TPA: hypothetical protein VMV34_09635 [Terriglobia bacterium]|nr:hypothetical protein [Terriglobia bacterium]